LQRKIRTQKTDRIDAVEGLDRKTGGPAGSKTLKTGPGTWTEPESALRAEQGVMVANSASINPQPCVKYDLFCVSFWVGVVRLLMSAAVYSALGLAILNMLSPLSTVGYAIPLEALGGAATRAGNLFNTPNGSDQCSLLFVGKANQTRRGNSPGVCQSMDRHKYSNPYCKALPEVMLSDGCGIIDLNSPDKTCLPKEPVTLTLYGDSLLDQFHDSMSCLLERLFQDSPGITAGELPSGNQS